jgi:glutamate-1-semialdehyde 2,1-aminomutase
MDIQLISHFSRSELETIRQINSWLPPIIFDSHLHCWPARKGFDLLNAQARVPALTFNCFPWEAHEPILARLFPKIQLMLATIGFPYTLDDSDNWYIAGLIRDRRTRPIVPILTLSGKVTKTKLRRYLGKGFFGLKMYPTPEQKAKRTTKIVEIFPPKALAVVNQLGLPIILHLPKDIFANLDELLALAREYPRMIFIVAHMGNVYCQCQDYILALKAIAKQPNIVLDTAMVADSYIIAQALSVLGDKRILFGSDAPFAYIRGQHRDIGNGETRLVSNLPVFWAKQGIQYQANLDTKAFKLMYLNIILSIQEGMKHAGLTAKNTGIKENIFFRNSEQIFTRR